MGAWRLAALIAVLVLPFRAGAKGEKQEDLNSKGDRATAIARKPNDPGWAKRRVALHLQALGQKGLLAVPVRAMKSLVGERHGARNGQGGARGDSREGWFSSLLRRMEGASLGRKKIAGHALGDQVRTEQQREHVLPRGSGD